MKVVVTGGSGFVGSHTIKALEQKGYDVFNYDLKEGYDIRDINQLQGVINKGDKVLHLAAVARFDKSDNDPIFAFETNGMGSYNISSVCTQKDAERLVYSSTGSVYMPIEEEPPITERFKCRGNSLYGCSKYVGELYVQLFQRYVVLRYAHLYGEGKVGSGAVNTFISRMERGLKPILYGGKQSADFTYIKDIVNANILALETENVNQVYNIGSGEELPTERVFNILSELLGYNKGYERLPSRTVDSLRFVFDISKARKQLGYKPKYSFRKGMKDYLLTMKECIVCDNHKMSLNYAQVCSDCAKDFRGVVNYKE